MEKCLFAPKKGQKGAKVDGAVGKNHLFCILLNIGSLDFFNILYKVRGLKGYKLPQTPFFSSHFPKKGKKGSKNREIALNCDIFKC